MGRENGIINEVKFDTILNFLQMFNIQFGNTIFKKIFSVIDPANNMIGKLICDLSWKPCHNKLKLQQIPCQLAFCYKSMG